MLKFHLLAALLLAPALTPLRAQQPAPAAQPSISMADSLRRAGTHQLHILYIHGMAAGGAGDFDSWGLRKSICDHLGDCLSPAGEMDGREYADQGEFALDAPPPSLKYLGKPVWQTQQEWNASAPFVIHWKLARTSGTSVYVDEINWWPLVFALKCREIVAGEADLIGPLNSYLGTCAYSKPDPTASGRYQSYAWLTPQEVAAIRALPRQGAHFNRSIKADLMDWGIADAVMAVGAMRPLLIDGIRQLLLKSADVTPEGVRGPSTGLRPDQEFVIVTHSLGSYLIFSALDIRSADVNANTSQALRAQFEDILRHTSLVYFFANQVRLLELADLDTTGHENMLSHLQAWAQLRTQYLKDSGRTAEGPPQVVAWNDPSDLLSWTVPPLASVIVRNIEVKNAPHWFWLFENPAKAHDRYAQNKKIIRQMMK
ncbi:MAG TPA: hypothetical protein VG714_07760 [Acidobacteriaceae bacterium]|nr:hypothetical protein [Acidobacteriaceae bacterium]